MYLWNRLESLEELGFHRLSRKGWCTVDHPQPGCLQWKRLTIGKARRRVFYLRLNGRTLLYATETPDGVGTVTLWESSTRPLASSELRELLGEVY